MLRCEKGLPVITIYFYKTDHFVSQKLLFFHKNIVLNFKSLLNLIFLNNSQLSKEYVIYFFPREHCHLQSQNGTKASLPPHHILSNHSPLSSHAAAAGQQHMASTAADTAGSLTHTPHTQWFISQLELTVSSTGILEIIKNFTIPKSFI
jgi:hypothetical protein